MAKKKGKSCNGRSRKDCAAQRKAEQLKLHKMLRAFVRKIIDSSAIADCAKVFETAVIEFRKTFVTKADCREEIIRRVHLIRPLVCECGNTEFARKHGYSKALCLKCKKVKSALAHCQFFRSMREPILNLGMLWMKERCPFFSIHQFSKEFGFAYSSCWLLSRKIDLILLEQTKDLEAIEGMDSRLFVDCFNRRSVKTPADCEPNSEQIKAEERHYGTSKTLSTNPSGKHTAHPIRTDVSHLTPALQLVYSHISNVPIGFDKLAEKTNLPSNALGSHVILLELNNLITPIPGDRFVLIGYASEQNSNPVQTNERSPVDPPNKPPKLSDPSHQTTADTIGPLLIFQNNGFSRKYLPMFIIEMWRALSILSKEQPLQIFDACVGVDAVSKADILQFDCPNKIRIPKIA